MKSFFTLDRDHRNTGGPITRRLQLTGWPIPILTVTAALCSSAEAQSREQMARAGEHVQEAFQAREDGDPTTFLDQLREAEKLRPGHPELIYYIAVGQTLTGDTRGAVESLERVANMGLGLRADADPDFDVLTEDPAFLAVLEKLRENRRARGTSTTAFTIASAPTFVPEGIAYDPRDGSFYVGSVHERRIVRVSADGVVSEFAPAAFAGLMSVMGMQVDPDEGVLWVCTAGVAETGGLREDNLGRSAVFKFDLESGQLLLHYHFSNSEQRRVVGDLAVASDGEVYVSDARGSGVHRIRAGGDFLETFVQPGVFQSPQGLALSSDQRGLYVADYSKGVYYVRRATREAVRLSHPENQTLLGIDGLVRDGDALIAVQNGTMPHRILRLELSGDGREITEVRVLAANLPDWDEPTLGLMVGDRFYYVANSQWNRFVDGELPPPEELADPRIMWLNPR
jgi:sugar lactone lactonase YvrE